MRWLYDISPQPNSTPMSGPRGRRNDKNNKPMPNIEVSSVLEIHRQLVIDRFQIGNIGSVSAEEMILNFMLNMDLFPYK